jgi:hypothetical protein
VVNQFFPLSAVVKYIEFQLERSENMISQFALGKPGNVGKIFSVMDRFLNICGSYFRLPDETERSSALMLYVSMLAEDFVTKEKVNLGKGNMRMKEAFKHLNDNYETVDAYISRYFGKTVKYTWGWRCVSGMYAPNRYWYGVTDWLPNLPLNIFEPSFARRFL